MSINSISSNAPAYQPPQQNPTRQTFQQLTQAIQSGDLSSAQTAYPSLIQAMPSQGANGANGQNNPFQQAIQSIGSALQSGNISGAQQALQAFQSQAKGAHHGHHHHGQTQQADTSTSTSSTTSNDNDGDNDSVTAASSLNLFA